jgi:beta-lactamase regulating signal transducer with metallopeptidase domain
MTTADLIIALARANLAGGAAVLVVLALRRPARRLCGAHVAYALWLLPPLAALGSVTPGWSDAVASADDAGRTWLEDAVRADSLAVLWLTGLAASAAFGLWRQARFESAARAGRAGPAVVGVIAPRLVAPADFADRFSDAERRLIRAHERAHMDRRDNLAGALAVAATWLCWFNPLVRVALASFRADQELACDATVMARLPRERRAYAETLLRSEPAAGPSAAFACSWLGARQPLAERIAMLARRKLSPLRRDIGAGLVALLCVVGFAAAWSTQPPPTIPATAAQAELRMELAKPDMQETAWVYGAMPAGRR